MQAKQLHLLLNCITILDPLYQLAFHMKVPMTWKVQNKNMFHNVSYGKHKKTEVFRWESNTNISLIHFVYMVVPNIYIHPQSPLSCGPA